MNPQPLQTHQLMWKQCKKPLRPSVAQNNRPKQGHLVPGANHDITDPDLIMTEPSDEVAKTHLKWLKVYADHDLKRHILSLLKTNLDLEEASTEAERAITALVKLEGAW